MAPTSGTCADSQTRVLNAGAKGGTTVLISTGRGSIGGTCLGSQVRRAYPAAFGLSTTSVDQMAKV
jgi:hypothetical protein